MAVIELRSTVNPDHILAIFPAPLNDFRAWDYSDKAISPYVAFSDCMGDYPTRHTPYGVMTSERIEEFLYALALYLKDKGANPVIADMWPRKPDPAKLMRFHELKYDEGKTVYFSEHGETSKAKKYKHDSRWREVPPWALLSICDMSILLLYSFANSSGVAIIYLSNRLSPVDIS